MRDLIRSWFTRAPGRAAEPGSAGGAETPDARLRIAACALLLELAHADQQFSEEERRHIEEALSHHFSVPPESMDELIDLAEQERRQATDLYQFTSVINESYDEGQRMLLAEIVWRVVLADGTLSPHEDFLMRKIGHLLELRPGYLAEARRRAKPAT